MSDYTDSTSETQLNKILRPQIGQICIIKGKAFKGYTWPEKFREYRGNKYPHTSRWYSEPHTPEQAYYVGYRVVAEGTTYLRYDGDLGQGFNYPEYHHVKSHIVWLFVTNERTTPFYAFPKDVEILGGAA